MLLLYLNKKIHFQLDIKNKLDDLGFNTNTSNSLENALKKADDKIPFVNNWIFIFSWLCVKI